jgi:hypothetical protein
VAAALRALWAAAYVARATTVAVLGPQDGEVLEAWVRAGFEAMPSAPRGAPAGGDGADGAASNGAGSADGAASDGGSGDGLGRGGGGGSGSGSGSEEVGTAEDGGGGSASAAPGARYGPLAVYGPEQRGTLLCVAPMRDLRSLELVWFVPAGALAMGDSKPWRVAGHVLVRGWGRGGG